MKKLILLVAVVAVAAITYVKASSERNEFSLMSLTSVESIAGCEVSSNASENRGYCMKNYNSGGDSCVSSGSGGEVRCSGNY